MYCYVAQGLLLDLEAATLTMWVNNKLHAIMVRPGMVDNEGGQTMARLEGPLRWAADVTVGGGGEEGAVVAIEGPLPPPMSG